MSVSFGCKCKKKDKNNWKVVHRNHNHSAFEFPKYEQHYSEYSTVKCLKCGEIGQTKAKYVNELKDIKNSNKEDIKKYKEIGMDWNNN